MTSLIPIAPPPCAAGLPRWQRHEPTPVAVGAVDDPLAGRDRIAVRCFEGCDEVGVGGSTGHLVGVDDGDVVQTAHAG